MYPAQTCSLASLLPFSLLGLIGDEGTRLTIKMQPRYLAEFCDAVVLEAGTASRMAQPTMPRMNTVATGKPRVRRLSENEVRSNMKTRATAYGGTVRS